MLKSSDLTIRKSFPTLDEKEAFTTRSNGNGTDSSAAHHLRAEQLLQPLGGAGSGGENTPGVALHFNAVG